MVPILNYMDQKFQLMTNPLPKSTMSNLKRVYLKACMFAGTLTFESGVMWEPEISRTGHSFANS